MKEFNMLKKVHTNYFLGILFLFLFILLPNNTAHGLVYKNCGGVQVCGASGSFRYCASNGSLLCGCPDGTTVQCGGQKAERFCGDEDCGLEDSCAGTTCISPVNGGWSAWSPASCPNTCGLPQSQQTRTCTNPAPSGGGANCVGSATQNCPATPSCVETPINGSCGGSTNSCASGTFSDATDGTCTNNWSCVGLNLGATASCSTAKPVVNGTWSCSGSTAVCNGASCGGTCTGTAPTCAPAGTWVFPTACPTACGQSQTTQTQVCSGGTCSGRAGTRICPATSACAQTPTGSWTYPSSCPTSCGQSQTTQTQVCTGGNGLCSGSASSRTCSATTACQSTTSGTLTPPTVSCTIVAGGNSCNISLSWSTVNPVGTSAVTSNYPSTNTTMASGNSGTNVSLAVPYASSPRTFYLYNNGNLLAQSVATASCASGTTWDTASNTCKTAGGPPSAATASIGATPASIPYNTSSTLNWSYANASSCTITPPGTPTGYPSGSGSVSTGNLTVTKTYTISCDPGPVFQNVTVTVQPQPGYNLTIIKSGQGTVTAVPVGTNCGVNCFSYPANSSVDLTATPAPGRIFTGWSVSCSGTGVCSLIMDESKSVIANFAVDPNFKEF